jgi:hypothetical protein
MFVERRLRVLARRLTKLRGELAVADEQLAHLSDIADDTRIRSLVSETPLADVEHRDAERTSTAMARHREELAAQIARLEAEQDELLDQMLAARAT